MPQLPISPVVSQPPSAGVSQSPASSSGSDGGAGLDGAQGKNFGEVLTKHMKKETSQAATSEGGEPTEKPDALAISPVDFSVLSAVQAASVQAASVQAVSAQVASAQVASAQAASGAGIMPAQAVIVPAGMPTGMMSTEAGLDKPSMRSTRADGDGEPAKKSDAPTGLPADPSVLAASPFVPMVPARVESGVTKKAPVEMASDKILMQHSRADEIPSAAKIAGDGKSLPAATPEKEFSGRLAAMVDIPGHRASAQPQSVDSPTFAQVSATEGGVVGALRQLEQPATQSVAPSVGSAEWGGAVGEKVLWMANQNHQVAELHLNPPNLGPLEVRLTINSDQASAMFVSHHAAVREAIEAALPRLREMLADNGIMLGNTMVGSESFSQQQQAFDQHGGGGGGRVDNKGMEGTLARISGSGRPASLAHDGMVDIFA